MKIYISGVFIFLVLSNFLSAQNTTKIKFPITSAEITGIVKIPGQSYAIYKLIK